jgi:hypothetical protein
MIQMISILPLYSSRENLAGHRFLEAARHLARPLQALA